MSAIYKVYVVDRRDGESHLEFMDRINRVLNDFHESIEVISISLNNQEAIVLYITKGGGVLSEVDLSAENMDIN